MLPPILYLDVLAYRVDDGRQRGEAARRAIELAAGLHGWTFITASAPELAARRAFLDVQDALLEDQLAYALKRFLTHSTSGFS